MGSWSTVICQDCGCDIHVHEDWSNTPMIRLANAAGRHAAAELASMKDLDDH